MRKIFYRYLTVYCGAAIFAAIVTKGLVVISLIFAFVVVLMARLEEHRQKIIRDAQDDPSLQK